ncbi:ankyrin repeat domain-containing protein [Pseudomonas monteilii]
MSKALLQAAASGQTAELCALLASGDDIESTHKATGRTALIEAAIKGHTDTVQCLIENAARIDRTDDAIGYTALGWAANQGHLPVVKALLTAHACVDLQTSTFQHTPLMVAAQEGHQAIVAALLAAGAGVNLQTGDARNALSMAQERGHEQVVATLQAYGAAPPVPPVEISIPWPAVSLDASDVDDTDPVSVLRGFLLAMHRWETDCYEQSQRQSDDEGLDWPAIQHRQNQIFERFCTPKPRTYGRLGSFGFPPTYSPDDTLIDVEPLARRTLLMTRQAPSTRLRYEMLFSLVRKGGVWRVDTKKERAWGSLDKWEVGIL